jgi:hypothetical protein
VLLDIKRIYCHGLGNVMAVSFIGGENRSTTAIFEIQQKDDNENNSQPKSTIITCK